MLQTIYSIAERRKEHLVEVAEAFEELHPERVDFWLFRRLVYSDISIGDRHISNHEPVAYACKAVAGLDDTKVAHDTLRVLGRLKYRQAQFLGGNEPEVIAELLSKIAVARASYKSPNIQDQLLCEVLVPNAMALLREGNEKTRTERRLGYKPRKTFAYVKLDWVQELYGEVDKGLTRAINSCGDERARGQWKVRDPLPVPLPSQKSGIADLTPWDEWDTAVAVSTALLNFGSYIEHVDFRSIASNVTYTLLLNLFGQARDLVQTAWLTLTEVLRHANALRVTERDELRLREVQALGQLARLERFCRNFPRSGIYAVFALERARFLSEQRRLGNGQETGRGALTLAEKTTLHRLAGGLGLDMPGRDDEEGHEAIAANTPKIVEESLRRDPRCSSHILTLEAQRDLKWLGFGEGALRKIADRHGVVRLPELLLAAFVLAVRTGALSYASHIVARFTRQEIRMLFNASMLMEYAAFLSSLSQKTVAVAHPRSQQKFRTALRKIWRDVACDQLDPKDLLYLHHAKVGWTHYSCANFAEAPLATWGAYRSVSDRERVALYERFMTKVRYGTVPRLARRDFVNAKMIVPEDEAFVSVVTRDGHEISVLTFGPDRARQPLHRFIEINQMDDGNGSAQRRDWHKVIEEFFLGACAAVRMKQPLPLHSVDLLRLGKIIIADALALNPNATRICIHADAMFRAIPWQYVFHTALRGFVQETIRSYEQMHLRTVRENWKDVVVCHVPGVVIGSMQDSRDSLRPHASLVRFDLDDSFCVQLGAEIEDVRRSGKSIRAKHLSLVAHGRKTGYAGELELAGDAVPNVEKQEQLSGFPFIVAHVCYGGFSFDNPTGDIGGLPGFFLSHGSHTVLASPTPVTKRQAVEVEKYLLTADASNPESVEDAYLNAVRANSDVGLYSLFTKRRAPVLLA